jgi:thymidylate synthase (FAD)
MKIIKPSFEIVRTTEDGLRAIEEAARTCYLSEPRDDEALRAEHAEYGFGVSFEEFVRNEFVTKLRTMGHQTPFEFMDIEIVFICDRGVSHEQVRHRMTSPMQESTRYCNYGSDGKHDVTFIEPLFFDRNEERHVVDDSFGACNKFDVWMDAMCQAEWSYNTLLSMGASPQEARSVLPNSLKTKLRVKANVREWWHIFKLRAVNSGAHPQIREIMIPALAECANRWPVLFEWLWDELRSVDPMDGTVRAKNPDS